MAARSSTTSAPSATDAALVRRPQIRCDCRCAIDMRSRGRDLRHQNRRRRRHPRHARGATRGAGEPAQRPEPDHRGILSALCRRGGAWVATAANGDIVGFAILDQANASVWALFVSPDCEAAGIGRALHDTMINRAARRGMKALWLVTASGTRAERFYDTAGWTRKAAACPGETRFEKTLVNSGVQ